MQPDGRRLLAWCVLGTLLFGLFVHYGAVADRPGHDSLRASTTALESPEQNTGEDVYFWAEVVDPDGTTVVVSVGDSDVTLRSVTTTLASGDSIQVTGRLQADGSVRTDRVVVSGQGDLRYLYVISALGALVAGVFLLRHWRIEWRRLLIEPRETERRSDA